MRHHVYSVEDTYSVALLIKEAAFNLNEIEKTYIEPLEYEGINRRNVIVIALPYENGNKVSQAFIKEQLATVLKGLLTLSTRTIYCADANYFKVLTKERKAEIHLGYKMECRYLDYEDAGFNVVLGINHKSILHNPANEVKLSMSFSTLCSVHLGQDSRFATPILKNPIYPVTGPEICTELGKLLDEPILFIDIEGFSLDFDKAKIATIAFAKNTCEGIAFACDWKSDNQEVRHYLRTFFENYQGYKVFHNAAYDVKSLILNIWMEGNLLDKAGMLKGLDIMCDKLHDTRIIAYLTTNTTAGNKLGLKDLSHEYVGNYGIDVKDITQHALADVLNYNLMDCCATAYVFEKYWPLVRRDEQMEVYSQLFMPSLKTIIQTEMVGMPLNPDSVAKAKQQLLDITEGHLNIIKASKIIVSFNNIIQQQEMLKDNSKLKKKQHSLERYSDPSSDHFIEFNPNSSLQLQNLLYVHMSLPVKEYTPKKLPSTQNKHVEALKQYTNDQQQLNLIDAITGYSEVQKILNTFITAFERALDKGDDVAWLHGSFILGGTKSGRLSSSKPNLQNLPSGKAYGKLIKSCFQAPKGWVFGGADFASLEDRISALQTKDPNKLKVYEDDYDSHSLRAYSYFPERLPGIENTVESINSIAQKFPQVRQDGKGVTFLLTYGGTSIGLKKTLGFPTREAVKIEQNYHKLYEVSDQWVQTELDKATTTGYVELAFGMRLKTPLLKKTLRNREGMLNEAKNEERTAGNALGQSYGLLNNRALNGFMQLVWDSPYRYDIMPISMIHDAIYLIWRDDLTVTKFVNDHLIQEMQWQDLDAIKHPNVKLEAELCLYHPTWADEIKLPNNCTKQTILDQCVTQHSAA